MLINCENCGKEISDQSKTCVHCGALVNVSESDNQETSAEKVDALPEVKSQTIQCPECGKETSSDLDNCEACGFPMEKKDQATQGTDNYSDEEKKSNKKKGGIIVAVVVAAVIVITCIVGYIVYQQQQEEKAAAEAAAQAEAEALAREQQEVTAYNDYISNANQLAIMTLLGASEAEDLCNTVRNVWNSAIWKSSKSEWDKEIRKYYASDFNDALSKLFKDKSIQSDTESIETNQEKVKEIYRQLQSTPDADLNSLRDSVEDLYDEYIRFTNLAINPTGSYQTYSQTTNEADSDFMTEYQKFKSKIPEEKSMPGENDSSVSSSSLTQQCSFHGITFDIPSGYSKTSSDSWYLLSYKKAGTHISVELFTDEVSENISEFFAADSTVIKNDESLGINSNINTPNEMFFFNTYYSENDPNDDIAAYCYVADNAGFSVNITSEKSPASPEFKDFALSILDTVRVDSNEFLNYMSSNPWDEEDGF